MAYVMVTADFPDITSQERKDINKCLKDKNFIKIECVGRDLSTTWHGKFADSVSDARVIEISREYFEECYKEVTKKIATKPPLAIQVGSSKHKTYNC